MPASFGIRDNERRQAVAAQVSIVNGGMRRSDAMRTVRTWRDARRDGDVYHGRERAVAGPGGRR